MMIARINDVEFNSTINSVNLPGLSLKLRERLRFCVYFILVLFLVSILFCGCSDVVSITGTLLTRLTNSENRSVMLVLSVCNDEGKLIKGLQVNILKSSDSSLVLPVKYSQTDIPLIYNLPEEFCKYVDIENDRIIIILYHPTAGCYNEMIDLAEVISSKIYIKEIKTGIHEIYLPELPINQYLMYKNF